MRKIALLNRHRAFAFASAIGAIGLAAGLSAAPAQASSVVSTYTVDLDANWGGPLDVVSANYGGAGFNGILTGGTMFDGENFGTAGTLSAAVAPAANTFVYEYTFTVGTPSNAAGTFVSQLGTGINGLSLSLYQGATPTLFSTASTVGNPLGSSTGPIAVGTPSTDPSTSGEIILSLADLIAGPTYTLVVSGQLAALNGVGDIFGTAQVSPVPVPGAVLLFGSAILGIGGVAKRRRIAAAVKSAGKGAGRLAMLVPGLGLMFGLFGAGTAKAATYTDVVSTGTWTPTAQTPIDFVTLNGTILGGTHPSVTERPYASVTTGSGTLTSFAFDYDFTLTSTTDITVALSQLGTTVGAGSNLELFSGTPNAHSLNPIAISSLASGKLVLSDDGLTAGSYFLAVTGALAPGSSRGTLTGSLQISAVPIPAAVLLFGSGLVGLTAAGRRRAAKAKS